MEQTPRHVERVFLALTLFNTLATSLIWGINTLFLLDAGLSITQAFAANAFFTAGQVLFEVPTGVVADMLGRRASYLLGSATLFVSTLLYLLLWRLHGPFLAWALVSMLLGLGFTFFSGATEAWLVDGLKFASFASFDPKLLEQTLTFNCHSKSFAMTGWRVGYIGGPKPVIDAINKLQSQINSHITSFTQPAAATALNDPRGAESVEQMRQQFEKRGRHMWERLSALPKVVCVKPQGAFYCFPNVSAYFGKTIGGTKITDAISFSSALLEHNHVAVVPGNDSGFDTHVRLSFATSMEQIDKGIDRIGEFLKKLG